MNIIPKEKLDYDEIVPDYHTNPSLFAPFEFFVQKFHSGSVEEFCAFEFVPGELHRWILEAFRFFLIRFNCFIANLQKVCTNNKCPNMVVGEFEFVCAAHDTNRACNAIDYCKHTSVAAIRTLTDPAHFKSRIINNKEQLKKINHLFRRLYRIYAHAAKEHEHLFASWEEETQDCTRFVQFCLKFELLTPDLIIK